MSPIFIVCIVMLSRQPDIATYLPFNVTYPACAFSREMLGVVRLALAIFNDCRKGEGARCAPSDGKVKFSSAAVVPGNRAWA